MRSKTFTIEDDETLAFMRKEGCSWAVIGQRLQCDGRTAEARAKFLKLPNIHPSDNPKIKVFGNQKINSTPEIDDIILKGCILGWSWEKIASEIGWKRDRTIQRGYRLNAKKKAKEFLQRQKEEEEQQQKQEEIDELSKTDAQRIEALPAGHPFMWKIISNGMENPFQKYNEKEFKPNLHTLKTNVPFFNKMHLVFD